MDKFLKLLIGGLLIFFACRLEDIPIFPGIPKAAFNFIPNKVEFELGEEIGFENTSTGANYEWTFGTSASKESFNGKDPGRIVYNSLGSKEVKLSVWFDPAHKNELKQTLNIVPKDSLKIISLTSDINDNNNEVDSGQIVKFTLTVNDTSKVKEIIWKIDDVVIQKSKSYFFISTFSKLSNSKSQKIQASISNLKDSTILSPAINILVIPKLSFDLRLQNISNNRIFPCDVSLLNVIRGKKKSDKIHWKIEGTNKSPLFGFTDSTSIFRFDNSEENITKEYIGKVEVERMSGEILFDTILFKIRKYYFDTLFSISNSANVTQAELLEYETREIQLLLTKNNSIYSTTFTDKLEIKGSENDLNLKTVSGYNDLVKDPILGFYFIGEYANKPDANYKMFLSSVSNVMSVKTIKLGFISQIRSMYPINGFITKYINSLYFYGYNGTGANSVSSISSYTKDLIPITIFCQDNARGIYSEEYREMIATSDNQIIFPGIKYIAGMQNNSFLVNYSTTSNCNSRSENSFINVNISKIVEIPEEKTFVVVDTFRHEITKIDLKKTVGNQIVWSKPYNSNFRLSTLQYTNDRKILYSGFNNKSSIVGVLENSSKNTNDSIVCFCPGVSVFTDDYIRIYSIISTKNNGYLIAFKNNYATPKLNLFSTNENFDTQYARIVKCNCN